MRMREDFSFSEGDKGYPRIRTQKKRSEEDLRTALEAVPRTGIEPACLATHAPETCASTYSATWALWFCDTKVMLFFESATLLAKKIYRMKNLLWNKIK